MVTVKVVEWERVPEATVPWMLVSWALSGTPLAWRLGGARSMVMNKAKDTAARVRTERREGSAEAKFAGVETGWLVLEVKRAQRALEMNVIMTRNCS